MILSCCPKDSFGEAPEGGHEEREVYNNPIHSSDSQSDNHSLIDIAWSEI